MSVRWDKLAESRVIPVRFRSRFQILRLESLPPQSITSWYAGGDASPPTPLPERSEQVFHFPANVSARGCSKLDDLPGLDSETWKNKQQRAAQKGGK